MLLMLCPHGRILDEGQEAPPCKTCGTPLPGSLITDATPEVPAAFSPSGEQISPAIPAKPARLAYLALFCDDCLDEYRAALVEKDVLDKMAAGTDRRAEWWRKAWLPGYHQTTLAKIPNQNAARAALQWSPEAITDRPGMIFVGLTGRGKSRTAYLVLRKLFEAGRSMELWPCLKLKAELVRLATHDDKEARPRFISRLATSKLLFLDDVGQAATSQAAAADMLDLIEQATMNGTPILATMQYTGDDLIARFAAKGLTEAGEAIVRRLEDFCETLNFDSL